MAAMRWFLAVILLLQTQVIEAFVFQTAAVVRRATTSLQMKWDPTRPPMTNMKRLEQRMDATWGRGKFRTEVWEGNVNPMNFWWEAYYFSDEEREALLAGYDMSDPAEWFRKQGLDPEECMERGKKYEAEQFELYLEVRMWAFPPATRRLVGRLSTNTQRPLSLAPSLPAPPARKSARTTRSRRVTSSRRSMRS